MSVHGSVLVIALLVLLVGSLPAAADTAAQPLPFAQDWSNTGLITVNDDWSGVPGVIGYRGDALVAAPGADPQTITADGSAVPDVNANQTNPNGFTTGGVSSSRSPTPWSRCRDRAPPTRRTWCSRSTPPTRPTSRSSTTSVTSTAPPTTSSSRSRSSTGPYTNLPAGYVADATTGPSLATQVTPVSVMLPGAAPLQILKGAGLRALIESLPERERYTYVFDGNSQVLDHILISDALDDHAWDFDVVHVNSEFHDQVSDHEP